MVEYSNVNVKLSDAQLKTLKTAAKKKKTGTTLIMSLKLLDGNDLPDELLLKTWQKRNSKLSNALNNNMSTDLTLSKVQISKITQFWEFLGSLLNKLGGLLMKVEIPLAENVLAPVAITAAASAIDAWIQKKIHGSETTTLIISNKEMNDIMKIVQILEDSNILLTRVTKPIKKRNKTTKRRIIKHVFGYVRS